MIEQVRKVTSEAHKGERYQALQARLIPMVARNEVIIPAGRRVVVEVTYQSQLHNDDPLEAAQVGVSDSYTHADWGTTLTTFTLYDGETQRLIYPVPPEDTALSVDMLLWPSGGAGTCDVLWGGTGDPRPITPERPGTVMYIETCHIPGTGQPHGHPPQPPITSAIREVAVRFSVYD